MSNGSDSCDWSKVKARVNPATGLTYAQYLDTDHWQTMRRLALEAADHACQLCGGTDELDVHHRSYERVGRERLTDLVALCEPCHERHHGLVRNHDADVARAAHLRDTGWAQVGHAAGGRR